MAHRRVAARPGGAVTGLSEGKQERETRRMGVCLCVCMSILSLCVEPWRLVGRRLEGNRQGVPSPGFPLQPVLQRRWRCVGSVRCVAHLWLAPPSISACPTAGDPKFCTQCGQGLAPGAKFCSGCGEAHFSVPLAAAACKLPWTRLDLSAPSHQEPVFERQRPRQLPSRRIPAWSRR